MLHETARRLVLRTLLIAPWLALNLSHASEPNYVPKAQLVVDNVYAIVGPLGQRSVANAGLNANYGFVVTEQGVILIDSGDSLGLKSNHSTFEVRICFNALDQLRNMK